MKDQQKQAETGETVAVQASAKAPRWLLPSIITLVAGGLGGGAVMSAASPKQEPVQVQVPAAQLHDVRPELERVQQDGRRELAQTQQQLTQALDRLDKKLDAVAGDVGVLKVDVGVLKAGVQLLKDRRH